MAETVTRLSSDEIADRLRSFPGWEIKDGKLTKAFTFDGFMGAVRFVDRIAPVAESEGHHPDLLVSWGRVVVELTTHSADGLTVKDFKLASLIEKL
jgi:4a-hydroxytetrahydrobiopterin dehydratase